MCENVNTELVLFVCDVESILFFVRNCSNIISDSAAISSEQFRNSNSSSVDWPWLLILWKFFFMLLRFPFLLVRLVIYSFNFNFHIRKQCSYQNCNSQRANKPTGAHTQHGDPKSVIIITIVCILHGSDQSII